MDLTSRPAMGSLMTQLVVNEVGWGVGGTLHGTVKR